MVSAEHEFITGYGVEPPVRSKGRGIKDPLKLKSFYYWNVKRRDKFVLFLSSSSAQYAILAIGCLVGVIVPLLPPSCGSTTYWMKNCTERNSENSSSRTPN